MYFSHPKNTWPAYNLGVYKPGGKVTVRHLSPYFSSKSNKPRTPTSKIDTLVLHYTGGPTAEGAINWLYQVGNSYHFIIKRDGTPIQTKPILERANHAGCSYGPKGPYVNNYSVGISFVSAGSLIKEKDITDVQLETAKNLICDIHEALKADGGGLKWITTHHAISPVRRIDPYTLEVREGSGGTKLDALIKKIRKKKDGPSNIALWKAGMGPENGDSWGSGLAAGTDSCADGYEKTLSGYSPNGGDIKWCKKSNKRNKCYLSSGARFGCNSSFLVDFETADASIKKALGSSGEDDQTTKENDEPETQSDEK